ncbi:AAA family ATPase [Nocardia abscessus]|uniref:AAA family ATPase n=1 Tax=Nocardia abscessus TaxID=120957 RepID=A0ABS0CEN9_9NOCA|nr:AAA family ATPase [Nocardia abscessus]MBF6228799.1 AAA family ATPase [Nocardia abscessus]
MLEKVTIHNFKIFREFSLEFNPDVNIIVGDNEAGKSTILEAIGIAMSGRMHGRQISSELTPHIFNQAAVAEYAQLINSGIPKDLPEIIIELFMRSCPETAKLKGTNNRNREDAAGIQVRIAYDPDYASEYQEFIQSGNVSSLPVEFYTVQWTSFAGHPMTPRSVPVAASMINADRIRLHSGADYYLSQIINNSLDDKQRVALTRAYRELQGMFSSNASISAINDALNSTRGELSDKSLSLAVDFSQRAGWESGLVPHLDQLPFAHVGAGEQNILKILLAISRKLEDSHIVLIEEPENHLSFSTLNKLIKKIEDKCVGRQIFITTHSSFVLNKLGLANLILLRNQKVAKLTDLSSGTQDFFMKLSGYDTLRLVLAKKMIVVEGDSDELVVQRAYRDLRGCLPIQDGVDVMDVDGLTAPRYVEIAALLNADIHVVTDNDKDIEKVDGKFVEWAANRHVHIHRGDDPDLPSLEENMIAMNGLEVMNAILGKSYDSEESLLKYMKREKTDCALAIFSTPETVKMPEYILESVR